VIRKNVRGNARRESVSVQMEECHQPVLNANKPVKKMRFVRLVPRVLLNACVKMIQQKNHLVAHLCFALNFVAMLNVKL